MFFESTVCAGLSIENAATVRSTPLRRVRNLYYTRGMAQLIYEEIINNGAKAGQLLKQHVSAAVML